MSDDQRLKALLQRPEFTEELAALEHERWAHWQRYLHEQCEQGPDGSLMIPADQVVRWTRQMSTPYAQLPEPEKDSDRELVRHYLPVIAKAVREYLRSRPQDHGF